jgi:putative hemolysin
MSTEPYQRRARGAPDRSSKGSAVPGVLAAGLILTPLLVLGKSLLAAPGSLDWAVALEFLLVLLVIILLNGLFVAGETAIDLLRSSHEKSLEGATDKKLAAFRDMVVRKPSFVAACSLGSMTMRAWMVAMTVVPAVTTTEWLRGELPVFDRWAASGNIGLGVVVMIAVLLIAIPVVALNVVLGELIPKSYAAAHPLVTSMRLYGLVKFFNWLFALPIATFMSLAGLVTLRFGAKASFAVTNPTEEEIKELLEEAEESGEIEEEEKEMVASVFEFGDTVVREIMTPRADLEAVPVHWSIMEVAKLVEESGHTRIPVYEGTDDTILGIVHAKDVLSAMASGRSQRPLRELMRPPFFVPESKPLHDLLQEMRQNKAQMAIVQDEHSGTAGVVTIEDIVEEVMGEIVDEYDPDLPQIVPMDEGFLSDGRMELDDVNEVIGGLLESDEFDTVGGYAFGLFGRMPKEGDNIEAEGFRFTVRTTDGKRIVMLYIEPLPRQDEDVSDVG